MSYFEFLVQWYNLPWLAAALGGGMVLVTGRRRTLALAVLVTGVAGLTLNGALHDLGLGPIGAKFPVVAAASLAAGAFAAWTGPRLRRRLLPPVTGVTFNESGLEGSEVIVLSGRIAPEEIGRARHRDEEGVVHVVRVVHRPDAAEDGENAEDARAGAAPIRFGAKRALGRFDPGSRAYEIR